MVMKTLLRTRNKHLKIKEHPVKSKTEIKLRTASYLECGQVKFNKEKAHFYCKIIICNKKYYQDFKPHNKVHLTYLKVYSYMKCSIHFNNIKNKMT